MLSVKVFKSLIFITFLLSNHRGYGLPVIPHGVDMVPIPRIEPESRLTVEQVIQNSGIFPIEINVPDTIMAILQGAQVAANNVAQAVPFLRPFSRPEEPRPLNHYILLLPARIGNLGNFIIPIYQRDTALRNVPYDINIALDNPEKQLIHLSNH